MEAVCWFAGFLKCKGVNNTVDSTVSRIVFSNFFFISAAFIKRSLIVLKDAVCLSALVYFARFLINLRTFRSPQYCFRIFHIFKVRKFRRFCRLNRLKIIFIERTDLCFFFFNLTVFFIRESR